MIKNNLDISGAFAFSVEKNADERGSLIRIFDSDELFPEFKVVQSSYVENPIEGTLRGLHFQSGEFAESKIIHCVGGKIFDVLVDLREESPTFGNFVSVTLGNKEEFQGMYVPKNIAHGYLTLSKDVKLIYLMDTKFNKANSSGIVWNDKSLNISWPSNPLMISAKDIKLPRFNDLYSNKQVRKN